MYKASWRILMLRVRLMRMISPRSTYSLPTMVGEGTLSGKSSVEEKLLLMRIIWGIERVITPLDELRGLIKALL